MGRRVLGTAHAVGGTAMQRYLGLLVIVMGLLVGCGGGGGGSGGDGISLGHPSVTVAGLMAGQSVTVSLNVGGELVFSGDQSRRFPTEVQHGKAYVLTIRETTGDAVCRFSNGQLSRSSSDARANFLIGCGAGAIPDDGGGDDDEGGESPAVQLSLVLLDSLGQQVGTTANPIMASRPGTVRARLLRGGVPASNQVVSFQATFGALRPASGTALTDSQGYAEIVLEAGSEAGAGELTARFQSDSVQQTRTINFLTLGGDTGTGPEAPADVRLGLGFGAAFQDGVLGLSATNVGSGSTLLVTANLVEGAGHSPWSGMASVSFTSSCVSAGTATIDQNVTAIAGAAVATYKPGAGCNTDVVRAQANLSSGQRVALSDTIDVQQAPANSIEFSGASPEVLGLKGAAQAGAPEVSVLSFLVKDSNGNPVPGGVEVEFEAVSNVGGFVISSGLETSTDSNGVVEVTVQSGTVPLVAGVRARLKARPEIVTTGFVSIQAGVATQDRFSMAVEAINPPAGDHLGVQVPVTVRAADRFGNWVPDGTRINFTSELGDIAGSCQTNEGGCSVVWTSQGPQSMHHDSNRAGRACFVGSDPDRARQGLLASPCGAHDRFGRSTITAWAVGEESFSDQNGNNLFDIGEQWLAMPEAFRDDNETGLHENEPHYTETFMDYNTNGAYDPAHTHFRGLGCSVEAEAHGHCERLANVRRSALIVLSTDAFNGYVFSPTAAVDSGRWESWQGGAPRAWGDAVLAGVTDTDHGGYRVRPRGGNVELDALEVEPGESYRIVVVMADLNGNAPVAGSRVEIEPGTLSVVGRNSCAVLSQTEALYCDFEVSAPMVPPTNGHEPIVLRFSSAAESLEVTRSVKVSDF